MELKVALFHTHSGFLGNRIFDDRLHRDHICYKWQFLRQYLSGKNINLQTYDVFEHLGDRPDIYFFVNLFPASLTYIARHRVKHNQCLLWLPETKVALNNLIPRQDFMWIFLKLFPRFFKIVLTYDEQLLDGERFRKMLIPQPFFQSYREYWEREKKKFSVMIYGNKTSQTKGELYSLRREIIRFFEERHINSLDLYGIGWNKPATRLEKFLPGLSFHTALYRGVCDSKTEIISNYQFNFCTQNQRCNNDIDEKMFDALFSGSIPVYYGAPNIADYIPKDCFVDFDKFESLDALYAHMKELVESGKVQHMRNCGWEFLTSERYWPFSVEAFSETVCQALFDLSNSSL